MTWMIVKIIVAVIVLTAFFTWTMVWFVRSSMSENPTVRRRLQLVDGLISVGVAAYYALPAQGKQSKLALMVSGLIIALWLFRGARFLLHREKA
jgi:hypothetical protein